LVRQVDCADPNKPVLALIVDFIVVALFARLPLSERLVHRLSGDAVLGVDLTFTPFRWIGEAMRRLLSP